MAPASCCSSGTRRTCTPPREGHISEAFSSSIYWPLCYSTSFF
jgi:hypothetical protein